MFNNIKNLRSKNGWSLAELADKVGVSAQQVSRLEKGENKLNEDTIPKFMHAFRCSLPDLLGGSVSNPEIPLRIRVGGGEEVNCDDFEKEPIQWLSSDETGFAYHPDHEVAEVAGHSMSPKAENGDYLLYNKRKLKHGDEIDSLIGKRVIAITSDNNGYYKLLKQGSKRGCYNLHSLNSSRIIENAKLQCVVPVKAVIDNQ